MVVTCPQGVGTVVKNRKRKTIRPDDPVEREGTLDSWPAKKLGVRDTTRSPSRLPWIVGLWGGGKRGAIGLTLTSTLKVLTVLFSITNPFRRVFSTPRPVFLVGEGRRPPSNPHSPRRVPVCRTPIPVPEVTLSQESEEWPKSLRLHRKRPPRPRKVHQRLENVSLKQLLKNDLVIHLPSPLPIKSQKIWRFNDCIGE